LSIRNLYFKVVVPIVAIVLASMAVVAFLAMRAMGEGVRLVSEQRAQFVVAYAQNSLEDIEHIMMADKDIRLQRLLDRLASNPDVDVVRVLSRDGKIANSSRPGEVGQPMADHVAAVLESGGSSPSTARLLSRPDTIHASVAVRNSSRCRRCHQTDDPVLGFVEVDVNTRRQVASMRTWGKIAGSAAFVQFLAVAVGIVFVLRAVVVRPVSRLVGSMGQVTHGDLSARAVPAGTGEIDTLVAGFNDMVERLQASIKSEEEARRARMGRVEQLATVGEMAASVAHEIRNPLSGVNAALEVIAKEHPDPESRQVLRSAASELKRVDGAVRQLLDYAKPKAPVMASLSLNDIVVDAIALTRPKQDGRETGVQAILSPDLPPVRADGDMLRQVIVNLVINACQAVEKLPNGQVDVSTEVAGGMVACRVHDNGPGVPHDISKVIFHPFYTTKMRGTGLGLATSQRLIEMHGGRLWLENPGEAGASFAFMLPAEPVSR
jgi:two-component system NtrC family sensor kinase